MPSVTVNATRMELTRLKNRLKTAVRGHKLLKDKRDELMKQFLESVRENRTLRRRVEEGLMRAYGSFTVASALMFPAGVGTSAALSQATCGVGYDHPQHHVSSCSYVYFLDERV